METLALLVLIAVVHLIGNSHAERLNGGSSANGGKPVNVANEPKAALAKL
jgi:hypothetical protein